jgi:phosphatidylserine decarboxylase
VVALLRPAIPISKLSLGERVVRSLWRFTPKRLLSKAVGWGARRRLPRGLQTQLLQAYTRFYQLDPSEAEHPIERYDSLQAFFTRRLRPEARLPATDDQLVVAPSDGTVCDAGKAIDGKLLEAKGSVFTLRDLVADEALASRLTGGPYWVIYLSPRDYHRVHFPLGGEVVSWTYVPGSLFPVGDRSVRRESGLFARNERVITVVDSPAGRYVVVMVAAVGVGHITASYDAEVATHANGFPTYSVRHKVLSPPFPAHRGQELGIFNLGSTTITIFEPGRVELDSTFPQTQIRMGAPIGRIIGT